MLWGLCFRGSGFIGAASLPSVKNGAPGSWGSPRLPPPGFLLSKAATFKRGVIGAVRRCTLVPGNLRDAATLVLCSQLKPLEVAGKQGRREAEQWRDSALRLCKLSTLAEAFRC